MKKSIIFSLIAACTVLSFSACDKTPQRVGETREAYIDATSKTTWSYFSLSNGRIVGTGEETEADNAAWAARTDWDIAVCRYNVRTNSGKATSVGAKGGTYIASESFEALTAVPQGASFAADELVTASGMGGTTSVVHSAATVITFMTKEDGSKVMPPVYLKAPVYIFPSADGANYYKVEFTQYQDENKVTGHVKFNYAALAR